MWQNLRKAMSYSLAVMLLVSLATVLYAEAARGSAKVGANNNGPKVGNKGTPGKNTPPNNIRKGDNRDDAKSGKVDRIGDGNSGQGDDKKGGFRDPKNDNIRPRHDPRNCPICKRHLPPHKEPPKRQPPQTNDKNKNDQGVRDRGQGEGRDDVGQGKGQGDENRKNNSLRKKWGADRREDIRDRREDRRDRREDIKDRKEDKRDAKTDGGKWDKWEDRRDRREDVKDRREDIRDRREDKRDNKYPPKRKWGAGDNRDDNKSGKIDRPGDGNSGQGNDRKLPPKRDSRIQPNRPQGGSSANTPDKRRGDNRDDAKSGKIDRPGDGNSGQGNDKDARLRPPHNPRTCPICNPKLRNKDGEKPRIQRPPLPPDGIGANEQNKDKTNNGVRDGGQGQGRDGAGQGKGQGDTNKENNGNSKK